jgi:hypothetical protein
VSREPNEAASANPSLMSQCRVVRRWRGVAEPDVRRLEEYGKSSYAVLVQFGSAGRGNLGGIQLPLACLG